jgi:GT2 family glycosyltransferase
MISVITCARDNSLVEKLSSNIADTIGTEFEFIAIDNRQNQYGICQAYNEGIEKSKNPFLCLVHEDVKFETKNWGNLLVDLMNSDLTIGIVGIAGSKAKPKYYRNNYEIIDLNIGHLKQGLNSWTDHYDLRYGPVIADVEDVVWIDGVFMFIRKTVTKLCRFDEAMLKGFHGYDVDFSLQAFTSNWRVVVYEHIDLYHYSSGNYTPAFHESARLVSKKWKRFLPLIVKDSDPGKWAIFRAELDLKLKYDGHWVYRGIRKLRSVFK